MILALICVLLAVLGDYIAEPLIYRRSLISDGEVWRLITGNLLHTNLNHLLLNLGGLFLIWFIFWDVSDQRWQSAFLIFPLLVNTVLLYWFTPSMEAYVGLSGALHGTIVAFGLADYRKNKWISVGLIIGVAIKLAYEQWTGSPEEMEVLIGAKVAIDAHLWGAISGLMIGAYYLLLGNKARNTTNE